MRILSARESAPNITVDVIVDYESLSKHLQDDLEKAGMTDLQHSKSGFFFGTIRPVDVDRLAEISLINSITLDAELQARP